MWPYLIFTWWLLRGVHEAHDVQLSGRDCAAQWMNKRDWRRKEQGRKYNPCSASSAKPGQKLSTMGTKLPEAPDSQMCLQGFPCRSPAGASLLHDKEPEFHVSPDKDPCISCIGSKALLLNVTKERNHASRCIPNSKYPRVRHRSLVGRTCWAKSFCTSHFRRPDSNQGGDRLGIGFQGQRVRSLLKVAFCGRQ